MRDLFYRNNKTVLIVVKDLNVRGGAENALFSLVKSLEKIDFVILSINSVPESFKTIDSIHIEELEGLCFLKWTKLFLTILFMSNINYVIGLLPNVYIPLTIICALLRKSYISYEHLVLRHYSFCQRILLHIPLIYGKQAVVTDFARASFFKIWPSAIVLPNIIFCDDFKRRVDLRGHSKMLFVGRNCYQKNTFEAVSLVESIRATDNITLDIYGKDHSFYKEPWVNVVGQVNQVPYHNYDVLVISSYYESHALVVYEALLSGLKVLCTKRIMDVLPVHSLNSKIFFYDDYKMESVDIKSYLKSMDSSLDAYDEIEKYNRKARTIWERVLK